MSKHNPYTHAHWQQQHWQDIVMKPRQLCLFFTHTQNIWDFLDPKPKFHTKNLCDESLTQHIVLRNCFGCFFCCKGVFIYNDLEQEMTPIRQKPNLVEDANQI